MTDQSDRIFVRFRGRTLGPLTPQRVQDLVRRGQITRMHELSPDGLSWSKAEEFGDFFRKSASNATTARPAQPNGIPEERTPRSAQSHSEPESYALKPDAEPEPDVQWYAHVHGENQGPVSFEKLMEWVDTGVVQRDTLVWRAGFDSWQSAAQSLPQRFAPSNTVDFSPAPRSSNDAPRAHAAGASDDLVLLALELNRRRGWAFFFGLVLIILASLQIIGQVVGILTASGGNPNGAEAFGRVLGGFLGLAFAGSVMTAGILILRYCHEVKEFATNAIPARGVSAAERLSAAWAFCGIASLVWLVFVAGVIIFVFALGIAFLESVT